MPLLLDRHPCRALRIPASAFLWGLLLLAPESVLGQALPTVGVPVLFDDFRYRAPVGFDGAAKSGADGTLFGRNPWLEGPDLSRLRVGAVPSRAWYAFGWQDEYAAYPQIPCATTPCDQSLFDGRGTEVATEPVRDAPGHVRMQFRGGAYPADRLISPLLTSGFAARTGTWVARVKLPTFAGLRSGNGLGVVLAPLWLKDATEAWETRAMWVGNTSGLNWWEANIEIWREPDGWKPYADVNARDQPGCVTSPVARRYLSAGNSWYRHSDASCADADGERRFSRDATFGACLVQHRPGARSAVLQSVVLPDQSDCLDALIGAAPASSAFAGVGHPYVYLVMQHTGARTRRALYARRERADGRPVSSAGFASLLLEQEQSNSVDAGFFSAQLQMILFPAGASASPRTVGPEGVEMRMDWFLYTPDTTLGVREAPDLARTVQQRLAVYNRRRPAGEQVWRVNTTGLALQAPVAPIDPWATCNPWRIEPVADWDFEVEHAERRGETTFTVQLLRDRRHDLRRMFQSVRWRVEDAETGRVADTVRDQGYTLRRGPHWGDGAAFTVTATVVQTSPVSYPPWQWNHGRDTECPDRSPAARTHAYRYDARRGRFEPTR